MLASKPMPEPLFFNAPDRRSSVGEAIGMSSRSFAMAVASLTLFSVLAARAEDSRTLLRDLTRSTLG